MRLTRSQNPAPRTANRMNTPTNQQTSSTCRSGNTETRPVAPTTSDLSALVSVSSAAAYAAVYPFNNNTSSNVGSLVYAAHDAVTRGSVRMCPPFQPPIASPRTPQERMDHLLFIIDSALEIIENDDGDLFLDEGKEGTSSAPPCQ